MCESPCNAPFSTTTSFKASAALSIAPDDGGVVQEIMVPVVVVVIVVVVVTVMTVPTQNDRPSNEGETSKETAANGSENALRQDRDLPSRAKEQN